MSLSNLNTVNKLQHLFVCFLDIYSNEYLICHILYRNYWTTSTDTNVIYQLIRCSQMKLIQIIAVCPEPILLLIGLQWPHLM